MKEHRKGPRRVEPERRTTLELHVPDRRSGVERRQIRDRRVPGHVLVVDTEPAFCDVLCAVIADAGHVVRRAVSRTDLLTAYLSGDIEVAVLLVPPLDTLNLIHESHPETQVVALVMDAEAAADAVGSAVALQEPFTEEKVRAALRIAIRSARQRVVGDSPA